MLLFLGRGKVAYLKPLKRTFQLKQNTCVATTAPSTIAARKPDALFR
jgi:hypothetical protein